MAEQQQGPAQRASIDPAASADQDAPEHSPAVIKQVPAPALPVARGTDQQQAQHQQQVEVLQALQEPASLGSQQQQDAAVLDLPHSEQQVSQAAGEAVPTPSQQDIQQAIAGEATHTRRTPPVDGPPQSGSAPAARQSAAKRGRPSKDKQLQAAPRKEARKEEGSMLIAGQHAGLAAVDVMQQPALGSTWSQMLQQQQQQLLSYVAGAAAAAPPAAETAGKQRKQVRRPPKTAGQQQGKGEGCCFSLERPFGSLSAATGHHSLMPPGFQQQHPQHNAWLLQQQQQQGAGSAADALRGLQAQEADVGAAGSAAGLKTRLSVRSVACIEELLQQTAHAASRGIAGAGTAAAAGAGSSSGSGQAAHPARPATQKGSVAVTSRLSVGNLLISPPMSRAPSTCVNPLPAGLLEVGVHGVKSPPGGMARRPGSAAGVPSAAADRGALSTACPPPAAAGGSAAGWAGAHPQAADRETALLPLNLAFPRAPLKGASPAVSGVDNAAAAAGDKGSRQAERGAGPGSSVGARTSTRQLLAATMAALEQQQQMAAAAGLLPAAAPVSRRSRIGIPQLQAAVAAAAAAAVAGVTAAAPASSNPDSPTHGQRHLPTAAEINRAAAAAVAAFQISAAAAAAAAAAARDDGGGSSSDTSSSGDDDRAAAMNAAAWTAYKSGLCGRPDSAGGAPAVRVKKRQVTKLQGGACSSSDTESPPSSPDSPASQAVLGVFAGSMGGRGAGAASHHAGGAQDRLPLHARKSDRQVGLETVSRIDAIFQQLRSLQPPAAAGTNADAASGPGGAGLLLPEAGDAAAALAALSAPPDAAATAAAVGPAGGLVPVGGQAAASAGAGAAAAAAGGGSGAAAGEVMGCSVAALCRGLRYEGDITLKEVAMAFQLRDAYDWDEDLEAVVAKEVSFTVIHSHVCMVPREGSRLPWAGLRGTQQ